MRTLTVILLALLLLPAAGAEKYTRERSEELFHLIQWRNYSPAAFEEALEWQKPLYLVLSAPAWCYWCHVYESEDYLYHSSLSPYINERFIPVFVDSDRRPDLTRKYLEGGWPSTTILAPDGRRITGFTGPREPLALRQYLEGVIGWMEGKEFSAGGADLGYEDAEPRVPSKEQLRSLQQDYLALLEASYDEVHGGYLPGGAPAWREGQKFPAPLADLFLLEEYQRTGNPRYLEMVQRTLREQFTRLDEMDTRYRLYDPVEGGFHRYATKRDWSVPHYEKLPEDQAEFILLLAEYVEITDDADARTALDGTLGYMLGKMRSEGGFFSSQDAHLEEEYYGKSAEERSRLPHPYVDRMTRADAQAAMALALLRTGHQEDARLALDFLERMLGERGMLYTYAVTPALDGQALANTGALLAFTEGFSTLGDGRYLQDAEKVAAFALDRLYDWRSGGFFERNSESVAVYRPAERISLAKHTEENALFAYGMLRLHLATGRPEYLEAGMKTLGALQPGGLDEGYFMAKAAGLAEPLLERYEEQRPALEALRAERLQDFFVDDLLDRAKRGVSLDDAPRLASGLEGAAFWPLALLAFLAGTLSFLSPCCLPLLSAQVAHSTGAGRGRAFLQTALFFLGLATVFSLFGMGAAFLGTLLREHRILFTRAAGLLIVSMGVMELAGRGFRGLQVKIRRSETPLGTVLFGGVFALGWSACIGPVLASLLLMASTAGSALRGTALLFVYALGLAAPLLLLSLWADRQSRIWAILKGRPVTLRIGRWRMETHSTSLLSGALLILLGSLIFMDALYALNRLALQTPYVQRFLLGLEQWLTRWLL